MQSKFTREVIKRNDRAKLLSEIFNVRRETSKKWVNRHKIPYARIITFLRKTPKNEALKINEKNH